MSQVKKKIRILIAEDEKPLARALSLKLEGGGFGVSVVHGGNDAITLLEKEDFDIILVDIMMPKGDGFSVIEAAQKKESAPHVVVLSNLSQEVDRARALEAGAEEFFIKGDTSLSTIVSHIKAII